MEEKLIGFTNLTTGEKLLAPGELSQELVQERHKVEEERQRAERLREQLRALGVDPVE